jgi:hypothetical protein
VDADDDTAAGRQLAAALFPRGALIHTDLPLLLQPWPVFVDGVCDSCQQPCGHENYGASVGLTHHPTCNAVRCDLCMGVRPEVLRWLRDEKCPWEWLCPLCTAIWTRKAAAGAHLRDGWTLVSAALGSAQPIAGTNQTFQARPLASRLLRPVHPARVVEWDMLLLVPPTLRGPPGTTVEATDVDGAAAPEGTPYRHDAAAALPLLLPPSTGIAPAGGAAGAVVSSGATGPADPARQPAIEHAAPPGSHAIDPG